VPQPYTNSPPAPLLQDGLYYWRVREHPTGQWSTPRLFWVDTDLPVPMSPVDTVEPLGEVLFEWSPVALQGDIEYQIQLDTSPNFVGVLFMDEPILDELFLDHLFLDHLFLDHLFLDPFFLDHLFLDHMALDTNRLRTLSNDKPSIDKIIQAQIHDTFFDPMADSGKPLSEGVHYWRVRARDGNGPWRSWSEPARFVVDDPAFQHVVINEISLNEPFWIELRNTDVNAITMDGWRYRDRCSGNGEEYLPTHTRTRPPRGTARHL
jgi:hypothetical protein